MRGPSKSACSRPSTRSSCSSIRSSRRPATTYQVIVFDTPPDGKDALVSGSVDFGIFGLAAATLGAASGQPVTVVAAAGGKAMAVVVSAASTG
jgi:hypothetical protein